MRRVRLPGLKVIMKKEKQVTNSQVKNEKKKKTVIAVGRSKTVGTLSMEARVLFPARPHTKWSRRYVLARVAYYLRSLSFIFISIYNNNHQRNIYRVIGNRKGENSNNDGDASTSNQKCLIQAYFRLCFVRRNRCHCCGPLR